MDQRIEQALKKSLAKHAQKEEQVAAEDRARKQDELINQARQRGVERSWPDFVSKLSSAATAINNVIATDDNAFLMEARDSSRSTGPSAEVQLSLDKKELMGVRLIFESDENGTATATAFANKRKPLDNIDTFVVTQTQLEEMLAMFFDFYVENKRY